jgi:hypothetical protein
MLANPMKAACGAKTRTGGKCRRAPAKGKARCRLHGGAAGSGAPFGPMNGSWRHGRYSREAREQRKLRHAESVQRLRAAELRARNRSARSAPQTPYGDQLLATFAHATASILPRATPHNSKAS